MPRAANNYLQTGAENLNSHEVLELYRERTNSTTPAIETKQRGALSYSLTLDPTSLHTDVVFSFSGCSVFCWVWREVATDMPGLPWR
jgi:hypothetical protein